MVGSLLGAYRLEGLALIVALGNYPAGQIRLLRACAGRVANPVPLDGLDEAKHVILVCQMPVRLNLRTSIRDYIKKHPQRRALHAQLHQLHGLSRKNLVRNIRGVRNPELLDFILAAIMQNHSHNATGTALDGRRALGPEINQHLGQTEQLSFIRHLSSFLS